MLMYIPFWDKSLLFLNAKTYELFAFALDSSHKENDVPSGYTETGGNVRFDVVETKRDPDEPIAGGKIVVEMDPPADKLASYT